MASVRALWVAAAWCLLLFVALQFGLLSLALSRPGAASNVWYLGAVQVAVIGTLAWAFAHVHRAGQVPSAEVGRVAAEPWTSIFALRAASVRWMALGVAAAVAFHAPVELLRDWMERLSPTPEVERLAQLQLLNHDTVLRTVSLFLVIGLAGPLLEEAFYRGCLFRYLERMLGGGACWLFTSVAFTLTHAAYRDWPSLLVVALVLGYLRLHSGSLWPGFAMHATFNSQSLLDAVTDTSTSNPDAAGGGFIHGVSLLACALVVAAIRRSKLPSVNA